MIELATHNHCPRCSNTTEKDRIYHCPNGHLLCEKCTVVRDSTPHCPKCDVTVSENTCIGFISPAAIANSALREQEVYPQFAECPRCTCNIPETIIFRCHANHFFCAACKQVDPGHNILCPICANAMQSTQDFALFGLVGRGGKRFC